MADTPADPTIVLDLLNAFRTSAAMFSCVSLGLFDRLAATPMDVTALAKAIPADEDALRRLTDLAVGLKLLERDGERLRVTPVSRTYLCKDSPRRMTGYIGYSDRVLWGLWANLADAVREGSHRWKQTYGLDGPIFSNFFRTEDDKREFLMGMHGFGTISSPEVVRAFDLSKYSHLCDLGGATGHLVIAACEAYPTLRATLFDLPGVIPIAKEVVGGHSAIAERVTFAGGDFFADPLPPADLYAVGRILHDWSEDKIHALLARIYEALPEGGALLVAEKLIADDRNGPLWAQVQSLNMLVCTEGKERTRAEYAALLKKAGFSRVEVRTTDVPVDAILAVK